MSTIDNSTLIQQFVQGKLTLSSNQNLRIEPALDAVQLMTKKGSVLATVKLASKIRAILVREESHFSDAISQILVDNNYMPTGTIEQGLTRYEQHHVPPGYRMNYAEARLLWKTWWNKENPRLGNHLQPNLMISTATGWDAIKAMAFSQGNVYVKTPKDELMLCGTDRVVWLSPADERPVAETPENPHQVQEEDFETDSDFSFSEETVVASPPREPVLPVTKNTSILSIHEGKLYIRTIDGEIVVEGTDLAFWMCPPEGVNIKPEVIKVPPSRR